jgi:hypothetical protein
MIALEAWGHGPYHFIPRDHECTRRVAISIHRAEAARQARVLELWLFFRVIIVVVRVLLFVLLHNVFSPGRSALLESLVAGSCDQPFFIRFRNHAGSMSGGVCRGRALGMARARVLELGVLRLCSCDVHASMAAKPIDLGRACMKVPPQSDPPLPPLVGLCF